MNGLLHRALNSVLAQSLQPNAILIHNDVDRRGAGTARQRLLAQVQTEWTAWIDSDDEWGDKHLEALYTTALATESVYVYSWFNGGDPLGHFGIPFNPCQPHHTTMAVLERTDIAQEAGFLETQPGHPVSNEDWHHIVRFSQICCERGLRMTHLAERTWTYHQQWGVNTSGRPDAGDAQ